MYKERMFFRKIAHYKHHDFLRPMKLPVFKYYVNRKINVTKYCILNVLTIIHFFKFSVMISEAVPKITAPIYYFTIRL